MAFHIRNAEAEEALRRLCEITGESLTDAVLRAVKMRLDAEEAKRGEKANKLAEIAEQDRLMFERLAKLPILDNRNPDEILGYDEHGLPS
jgi:antitoxin VapB